MFNTFFEYKYIRNYKELDSYSEKIHEYQFISSKTKYCVRFEEYELDIYAVKFYLYKERKNSKRYTTMSNLNEVMPILRTIINIIVEHSKECVMSSYVIIGASVSNEIESKRYRLYKRVIELFFSPVKFEHHIFNSKNAYILLNNDHPDKQDIINSIEKNINKIIQ